MNEKEEEVERIMQADWTNDSDDDNVSISKQSNSNNNETAKDDMNTAEINQDKNKSTKATDSSLPEPWVMQITENGQKYYYDKYTRKSVWELPDSVKKEMQKQKSNYVENSNKEMKGNTDKRTRDDKEYDHESVKKIKRETSVVKDQAYKIAIKNEHKTRTRYSTDSSKEKKKITGNSTLSRPSSSRRLEPYSRPSEFDRPGLRSRRSSPLPPPSYYHPYPYEYRPLSPPISSHHPLSSGRYYHSNRYDDTRPPRYYHDRRFYSPSPPPGWYSRDSRYEYNNRRNYEPYYRDYRS
ncbi:uncharacterized protein BX663DRAFT_496467 [Cokeromyces recurvatus]|uniref:uncharacterized protein n=1 Tax=Cokeromyces recurvatus TaxID=90255 RepID=UPI00221F6228|nr:uncharacterized protein BX663DRAFT_496467 [Cokeromyces recurvatus]KAI7906456.1 hypothetical protein BX663DRAFT_496467 [Cokeromyces recurvatus]